jgi:superfamily I DNA/RNA helicase
MSLSEQQRAAVEREGQDVCVVAGPGSGKTRVLVERFRWLVESRKVSPLRSLAITFTEKAAHEIKARLVDTFQDEPSIRRSIERAYVSTLHAFCMRLLRENAIAAGVDPRFEILDERDARTMLRECAEQALDELFAGDPDGFRSLLSAWKTADPAADLMAIYEPLRAGGDSPPALAGGPAYQGVVDGLIAAVREMRRASPRPASKAQQTRLDALDEWLARAEGLRAQPVTPAHFGILKSFDCDKRGLKAGHPIYDTVDTIKKEKIPAARAELASEMYGSHRRALLDTVLRFDGLYRQRKRALSALDFSDLEERAITLLRGDAGLRETVSNNFEAILMDELQDTNPLQWTLMDLLRRKDRFFAVGDINQSIFGFRHAEPRVFQE